MFVEDEWLPRILAIDERLKPIATRPVDITAPGWVAMLKNLRPLDDAGVRSATEELLQRLVDEYASGDDAARTSIRALFRQFPAFAWAAELAVPKTTATGFRAHLLHFSMLDQGPDPRDATLSLDHLVGSAQAAGIDVSAILSEVAALSSREDRYRWGSTGDWLLRRAGS
jgi:hypothetical protein